MHSDDTERNTMNEDLPPLNTPMPTDDTAIASSWGADRDTPLGSMIDRVTGSLDDKLPAPPVILKADIDNITPEQGLEVLRAVRRCLMMQLLHQETHEHMLDDCGDYLTAATENWARLYDSMWCNDFTGSLDEVKLFLNDFVADEADSKYPRLACDGDVRFAIVTDADPD